MFASENILDVQRGRCKHTDCECSEFMRENPPRPDGSGAAFPLGWCIYCGHAPAILGRLEYIDAPSVYIGPCIVWGERKHLICGSEQETIQIWADTSPEKTPVMCLCMYYIKDLTYPAAYDQLLGFVQSVVKPGSNKEVSWAHTGLKNLLTALRIERNDVL